MARKHCTYLQYQVSRKHAIRTPRRTVLIETLHKDPRKVSSADLNSELHLDFLQPHQPRLCSWKRTCASSPEERRREKQIQTKSLFTFTHACGTSFRFLFLCVVVVVVLPGGVASTVGGSRPFGRRCHGALIQLTQRLDGRVIIWSASSTGLGS